MVVNFNKKTKVNYGKRRGFNITEKLRSKGGLILTLLYATFANVYIICVCCISNCAIVESVAHASVVAHALHKTAVS